MVHFCHLYLVWFQCTYTMFNHGFYLHHFGSVLFRTCSLLVSRLLSSLSDHRGYPATYSTLLVYNLVNWFLFSCIFGVFHLRLYHFFFTWALHLFFISKQTYLILNFLLYLLWVICRKGRLYLPCYEYLQNRTWFFKPLCTLRTWFITTIWLLNLSTLCVLFVPLWISCVVKRLLMIVGNQPETLSWFYFQIISWRNCTQFILGAMCRTWQSSTTAYWPTKLKMMCWNIIFA